MFVFLKSKPLFSGVYKGRRGVRSPHWHYYFFCFCLEYLVCTMHNNVIFCYIMINDYTNSIILYHRTALTRQIKTNRTQLLNNNFFFYSINFFLVIKFENVIMSIQNLWERNRNLYWVLVGIWSWHFNEIGY